MTALRRAITMPLMTIVMVVRAGTWSSIASRVWGGRVRAAVKPTPAHRRRGDGLRMDGIARDDAGAAWEP